MERDIRDYLTLRGMIGASLFVISSLFALYASCLRTSIVEMVIEIVCLLVITPAACLWINRKSASASPQSSVSK
jgi:hypothetical protein